jgi:hypothetical protein
MAVAAAVTGPRRITEYFPTMNPRPKASSSRILGDIAPVVAPCA